MHDRQVRALVADEDALAGNALRAALVEAGVSVVAQARDAAQVINLAGRCAPDIIVMDARLPGVAGRPALEQVMAACPGVRVVLLAARGDDDHGVLALARGASGYLSREMDLESLARAVERVSAGEAAISRTLAARLVEHVHVRARSNAGMRPVKSPLTTREWEVLDLMAEGGTTSEIARILVLSTDTVNSHVHHILHKLRVRSRAEAIQIAERARQLA